MSSVACASTVLSNILRQVALYFADQNRCTCGSCVIPLDNLSPYQPPDRELHVELAPCAVTNASLLETHQGSVNEKRTSRLQLGYVIGLQTSRLPDQMLTPKEVCVINLEGQDIAFHTTYRSPWIPNMPSHTLRANQYIESRLHKLLWDEGELDSATFAQDVNRVLPPVHTGIPVFSKGCENCDFLTVALDRKITNIEDRSQCLPFRLMDSHPGFAHNSCPYHSLDSQGQYCALSCAAKIAQYLQKY